MSNTIKKDLQWVRETLPRYYTVNESKSKGSIHCCSTGTNKGMNAAQWDSFTLLCKSQFGGRLQEFFHHVNADHQDFTIYLKS